MRYLKVFFALLLTLTILTGCGPKEVVKGKTIYLSDLPAYNKYTEVKLDNYQFTNPDPFLFNSEETADGVIDTIKEQLGETVSVTEFPSSYGIIGYLLKIQEDDHIFYQDFYDPVMTFWDMSDKYHGYELNGGDIYLLDSDNNDLGEILFPMVIIDSDYTYEENEGERSIYSWHEEELQTGRSYPLRGASDADIDYPELLYTFYDDLDCYNVEKVSDHKIKVTADKSVLDNYKDTENGMIEYIPSEFYYLNDFFISIEDNNIIITLE